jgi:hypothetical protein
MGLKMGWPDRLPGKCNGIFHPMPLDPHELRMIRLGATRKVCGLQSGDWIRFLSISAAFLPISSQSYAITVNRGVKQSAQSNRQASLLRSTQPMSGSTASCDSSHPRQEGLYHR